jgi:hypothetical protein
MKTKSMIILLLGIALALPASAQPDRNRLSYYGYITDLEHTEFNEIIWFWTGDTMYGPLHSNDFIGLKYSPQFMGPVSTCKNEFRYYNPQNFHFEFEPQFRVPPVRFPRTYPNLRDSADIQIDSDEGRLLTHIVFRGVDDAAIFQSPMGRIGDEEEIGTFALDSDMVVSVNGELDVEGLVHGRVTLYATGDIGLPNDLRYLGTNARSGAFDSDTIQSMLGVVSEQNITIRNTLVNGKDNGAAVEPNNWDRHSILLNGSYIALGESFTFEHQNDDWDRYQGPSPDERGIMYLQGGLAQQRRGYVHRANHTGTGYTKQWRYDHRLMQIAPPGLMREEDPDITGEFRRLHLEAGRYTMSQVVAQTLILDAGVSIDLLSSDALTVSDSLIISGTPESPVRIRAANGFSRITLRGSRYPAQIAGMITEGSVEVSTQYGTVNVNRSVFSGEVSFFGGGVIDSCQFDAALNLTLNSRLTLTHSVMTAGIVLNGSSDRCTIDHCTIIGGRNASLRYRGNLVPVISNSIVAFGRYGILSEQRGEAIVEYSDVFGNVLGDYIDCQAGEGCISADPRLVNVRGDDFNLDFNSPCIDAGDPTIRRDPDGTRSDMGAFYFDHILSANSPEMPPSSIGITVSPNPFNGRTTVSIRGMGAVEWSLLDVSGRKWAGERVSESASFSIDGGGLPAGVYFVMVHGERTSRAVKLALVK